MPSQYARSAARDISSHLLELNWERSHQMPKLPKEISHFKSGFIKRFHLTTPWKSSSKGLLTLILFIFATWAYLTVERISL
jgi:hypothetical protein